MRRTATFLFVFLFVAGNGHAGVPEAQAALDMKNFTAAIQIATDGLNQSGLSAEDARRLHAIRGQAREAAGPLAGAIDDPYFQDFVRPWLDRIERSLTEAKKTPTAP